MKAFEVRKDNLEKTRLVEGELPEIDDGEVLLGVDRFAFTANNITYAVFGETMHYWDFFPAADGWGIIPVWGFADVVRSRHEAIEAGERFYGYYPMATHLRVVPVKVGRSGFSDGASHRMALPDVYNRYLRTSADPGYDPALEPQQMLYRPLFMTSFLLEDFLVEESFFAAEVVVLTSASSKTAFSLAYLLQHRSDTDVEVIGLTSAGNLEFVRGLGCYDRLLSYEEIGNMRTDGPVLLVDFAGNAGLRRQIHERLGEALRYSCSVGASHWEEAGGGNDLPGPRPVLFFAPDRVKKRMEDWGPGGIEKRVAESWSAFIKASADWLTIREEKGEDGLERVYRATLAGRVPPSTGQILVVG